MFIDIKINAYFSKSYIVIKIHARNTLAISSILSLRNLHGYKIILSYNINLRAGYFKGCFMIPRQKDGGMSILSLCMCSFGYICVLLE